MGVGGEQRVEGVVGGVVRVACVEGVVGGTVGVERVVGSVVVE